ncbi:MAG TPA: GNVR domain-containing protein [Candidatus Krumholzibacteria bacterium]|nr:GNVR domain-containing protein [Candidatus Krumholzibacteria bacterium]
MLFFFRTLIQWRKFILLSGLASAVLLGAISFILPSWYKTNTIIFPPEQTSTMPYAALMQQLSAPLLGTIAGSAGGVAPGTIYIEMMKSRTVCEQIIEEFGLMKRYNARNIEEAMDTLHSHLGFTLQDNGLLFMTVEDRDPQRAADMANRMVALLDQTTRKLKETSAARTAEFVHRQLLEREVMLAQAEDSLKHFQQAHNTVNMEEQLKSAMDIVTTLSSRAIALETEMQIMTHYTSPNSEEYQRKQTEYNEVLVQLRKLKADTKGSNNHDTVRSFIPTLQDVPEQALQYLRLRREVEIQNTVFTMLNSEYEKARIEEARDTPVVQVLDPAEKPNLRYRPQRKVFAIVGGLLGLGWSTVVALFRTAWSYNLSQTAVVRELATPVARDFSRLRRRRNQP